MLAPHGVKPGEFDMVFAGATSARASALQAGAVDAAILLPPFNFQASAAGFNELGLTVDYAPELPFSGTVVNRNWAAKNRRCCSGFSPRTARASPGSTIDKNRAEAVAMMVDGEPASSPTTSRSPMTSSARARSSSDRHDLAKPSWTRWSRPCSSSATCRRQFDMERLVLPGVTQLSD